MQRARDLPGVLRVNHVIGQSKLRRIEKVEDLAPQFQFLLPSDDEMETSYAYMLSTLIFDQKPKIGVSLRPWSHCSAL